MFKIFFGVVLAVLMAFGSIAVAQRSGNTASDSFDNNNYIAPEENSGVNERHSWFDDSFDTNNFREPPEDEGTIHPETRGYYENQGSRPGSPRQDAPDQNVGLSGEVKPN